MSPSVLKACWLFASPSTSVIDVSGLATYPTCSDVLFFLIRDVEFDLFSEEVGIVAEITVRACKAGGGRGLGGNRFICREAL